MNNYQGKPAQVASLVAYLLAIVSMAVTAFNLYLFAWLWTSLQATQAGHQQQLASGSWQGLAPGDSGGLFMRQLELIKHSSISDDEMVIKFNGKLISKKLFIAERILGSRTRALGQDGASILQLKSNHSIEFKMQANPKASLIVTGEDSCVRFPNGLIVRNIRHSNNDSSERPKVIECSGEQNEQSRANYNECQVHVKNVKLVDQAPVSRALDARRVSIQTESLRTHRLHSPTNKLQLMSSGASLIETKEADLHLQALDDILLGSRTSSIKMDILKDIHFKDLQVIGQSADRKFIFCFHTKRRRIICFDQHAADERIRYEKLLDNLTYVRNLDEIKSRACHGAIRFGCKLNFIECCHLIAMLLRCKIPTKCAHSRCGVCVLESLDKILYIERLREGSSHDHQDDTETGV